MPKSDGWKKKRSNIEQMLKAFHQMPQAMANVALQDLQTDRLNFNPIGIVTGNLVNSWGTVRMSDGSVVLKQVKSQAPYAPKVMTYVSIARVGKPVLELVMDDIEPGIERAVKKEFQRIESTIAAGKAYKFNPAAFEAMIRK